MAHLFSLYVPNPKQWWILETDASTVRIQPYNTQLNCLGRKSLILQHLTYAQPTFST